jgi:hypothetical protein
VITRFYVTRTARIYPARPHIADTEHIDGDATAVVRPYLAAQERADLAGAGLSPEVVEAVAYDMAAAELRAALTEPGTDAR